MREIEWTLQCYCFSHKEHTLCSSIHPNGIFDSWRIANYLCGPQKGVEHFKYLCCKMFYFVRSLYEECEKSLYGHGNFIHVESKEK